MKKKLIVVLQIAVAVILLTIIFYKLQHSGQLEKVIIALRNAQSNWPYLVVTLIGMFMSAFFCTVRWGYLLKSQDINIGFGKQFSLYMTGQFFSGFMLGSTGGDVIKGYYAAMEAKGKQAEIVATVIVDRIAGIIALILTLAALTLCRIQFFLSHPQTKAIAIFNIAALVIGIAVSPFFLNKDLLSRFSGDNRSKVVQIINKLYNAMHLCFKTRGVLVRVLIFSFLNQLSLVMWAYYIALAIGIESSFVDIFTAVVIMNTVAAIPISVNGLGTRESSAILMLGLIGISSGTAVTFSLLCYVAILVLSIIGGGFYVAYTVKKGHT